MRTSQRSRMLRGMVDAVAEKGYANTTVADVVERARASRETFYEQFANKQQCFLAAYEESVTELTAAMREAVRPDQPARVQFEQALEAYLEELCAEPRRAHTFLIDVYAAGPEARRRRAEVLAQFGDIVFELLGEEPRVRDLPEPRFAMRALAAAISSMVTGLVASGDYGALPGLKAPLMELLDALAGPPA